MSGRGRVNAGGRGRVGGIGGAGAGDDGEGGERVGMMMEEGL